MISTKSTECVYVQSAHTGVFVCQEQVNGGLRLTAAHHLYRIIIKIININYSYNSIIVIIRFYCSYVHHDGSSLCPLRQYRIGVTDTQLDFSVSALGTEHHFK